MDVIDLFNSEEMELPKNKEGEKYEKFLIKIFNEYLIKINSLSDNEDIANEIKANEKNIKILINCINNSLKKYLQGYPEDAYKEFKKGLKSVSKYFNYLYSKNDVSELNKSFFRIRLGNFENYKPENLFHVPFEERQKIETKRYSLPGFPSLYLGGSSYVCWEELKRPSFNDVHISRLEFSGDIKIRILDIGYRPALIASAISLGEHKKDTSFKDFFIANAICWPLIAACSIKVEEYNTAFQIEYVMPQFVTQFVRKEQTCHGIRFFSMHITKYYDDLHLCSNYVFPVRRISNQGYCKELKKIFNITKPVSWQIGLCTQTQSHSLSNVPHLDLQLIDDYKTTYALTDFGRIESILFSLKPIKI